MAAAFHHHGFMPFLVLVYASFTPLGARLALGRGSMINRYNETMTSLPSKTVARKASPRFASGTLELNVIFTDPQATAAALNFAESFACELGGRIRLRAAIAVPHQLPLDEPPVSAAFLQENLRSLASQVADEFQPTVHLYVCRDRVPALLQVLRPNSLVVLGGRKHWWPTAESKLARALRAKGHCVILVDSRARTVLVSPTIEPKIFAR
jgi:hypothetical protein